MSRETQEGLNPEERSRLLGILEDRGKNQWFERWERHMAFPDDLNPSSLNRDAQEKVLRYLLLRVLINQQAKFEKVREMSTRISENFADLVLFEPSRISESQLFNLFKEIAGPRGSLLYKVGALGGIKPISLFTYRFKAYEAFIKWLAKNNKNFHDVIIEQLQDNAHNLFYFLNTHPVLEPGWVGNDPKACRMFVNWVIFLLKEVWRSYEFELARTLMIVDGHVGKVFCRTGLLNQVFYEQKRPYIIQASKMRAQIEEIVAEAGKIPFYVDNGAFYLFEDGFCTDLNPNCNQCPIRNMCLKYRRWTAYQIWRE